MTNKFRSLIVLLAAIAAVPVMARPGPHPGHGPRPYIGYYHASRHYAPPPRAWHGSYRYYGGYHHRHYYGDWILPVGLGLGMIALSESASADRSAATATAQTAPTLQAPQPVQMSNTIDTQEYFYCPAKGGYYPDVKTCPSGWTRIIPQ